jgi:hypothetical protein
LVLLFLSLLSVVVFLYFVSTPLPEGQQGAKARSTYRQNSSSHQSNSLGFYRRRFFCFREITIISGTKRNLVQVEWDDKKYFIIRKR